MKSGQHIARTIFALLSVGLFLAFTVSIRAQVQSETTTTPGQATKEVNVERGEVVYVSGNTLVVKAEDGTLRTFENVPETARVDVGGQMLGIHELKPGMKLQRTITTTTTPHLVTKVETVTGTVFHVIPPLSVVLTLENGENQKFTIPKGQKFNIDGQEVDAFGLKKGMKITATRVTEVPETHVNIQRVVTGQLPPPPPPPPEVPVLIVYERHIVAPTPTVAEAAPEALPKTGSYLPAIGLLGVLMMSLGLGLGAIRVTR